jgi:MinD-like ATPase involved in chromosome partitioning or flagellar assembly
MITMPDPCVIGVVSQKGGVGKTVLAVNLSVILRLKGYRVLTVDGDTSDPNIALQLGMENANIGFKELATKRDKLDGVVAIHGATGLHVVLGTIRSKPYILTKADVKRLASKLKGGNYDFIILDTAPGFYEPEAMKLLDEAILVATPDTPAVTGILRLNRILKGTGAERYIVLNKVKGKKYELQADEIEDASGDKVVAAIPDDDLVNESLAERIPACMMGRSSEFSKAVTKLAIRLSAGRKRIRDSGPE